MSSADTSNCIFKKNYFDNSPSDTHIFSKALKIDYVICERPLIYVRLSINEEIFFRLSCRKKCYQCAMVTLKCTCTMSQFQILTFLRA